MFNRQDLSNQRENSCFFCTHDVHTLPVVFNCVTKPVDFLWIFFSCVDIYSLILLLFYKTHLLDMSGVGLSCVTDALFLLMSCIYRSSQSSIGYKREVVAGFETGSLCMRADMLSLSHRRPPNAEIISLSFANKGKGG